MKHLSIIAGALLGLAFVVFGLNFFLKFLPMPPPEEGSQAAAFMGAMYSTGFLAFVKILEILGGILVAIPATRNYGLLILVPIIVNILAYHIFIAGDGILQPPTIAITLLAGFLLWVSRASMVGLLNCRPAPQATT